MGKMNDLMKYLDGVCILFKDYEPMRGEEPAPEAKFVTYRMEDGKCIISRMCSCCEMLEEDVIEPGTDYLYIGNCPESENPFGRYSSERICRAYIIQLRNVFGKEPDGARLYGRYESGEGGYTVCCEYTYEKPYSVAYAFMLESELQEHWTPAAKRYLEGGE